MLLSNRYNKKNQATNLPNISVIKMQKVKVLKYNSRNPYKQAIPIKFALILLRLEYIINSSIPYPTIGNLKFNKQEYQLYIVVS